MKIIELRSENVKRIVALTIHPGEDPVVVLSGENGAGKSSALDSIIYALGGAALNPPEVIRRGEKNATVEIDLGDAVVDYTVKCRWTPGGRVLSVESKDGARFPSPQAFVEKLYGSLSFDPLAFIRLRPQEQMETVRRLVGVDTTAIDAEYKALYDARTAVTTKGKALAARYNAMPDPAADVPDAPVSVSALLDEQTRLQAVKADNDRRRAGARDLLAAAEAAVHQAKMYEVDRVHAEQALVDATKRAEGAAANAKQMADRAKAVEPEIAALVDPDVSAVYRQIAGAEATNAAVAAKKARAQLGVELEATRAEKIGQDEKLEALALKREKDISAAKFPVDGMSFSTDGLTFNGLPLEQASSAEQLRVGMAMGMALNPKLRVVLIRDGSLLDNKSLGLVAEMAKTADFQVWLEKVSAGKIGFEIVEGFVVSRDGVPVERPEQLVATNATVTLTVPLDDKKPTLALVPTPPPSAPKERAGPKRAVPTFKKRPIPDLSADELQAAIAEVEKSIAAAPLAPKSTPARAKLEELKAEVSSRLDAAIDGTVEGGSREPGEEG